MSAPEKTTPPASGVAEGASIAVGANAKQTYARSGTAGKPPRIARNSPVFTRRTRRQWQARLVTFRARDGQVWCHGGKRGRVLELLATMPDGVTQWDCLPWHTRLGASICVLRDEGLSIRTTLEGEYRHARYHLLTPGALIIQGNNSAGLPDVGSATT